MPERLWMLLIVMVIAVFLQASAKLAALEENLEKLEDERTAWDDERDRLLIREKNLKQQHDDCRSQLKAAELATNEEKSRRPRTESDLEELRKELLRCNLKTITQEVLLAKAQSGEFKEEEVPTTGNSGYKDHPMLKSKSEVNQNERLNGIAILNDEIFAVTSGSNVIQRFDSTTLLTKQTTSLDGYTDLQDIQPCNQSQSLFVTGTGSTGPFFISSVDPYNNKFLKSWAVDCFIRRLSVTEDCHVIAICYFENKIIEYSETGHLIREIVPKPGMGIGNSQFALKMINGNYLVSYGGDILWAPVNLAILNSNGDVSKSYSDASQKREMFTLFSDITSFKVMSGMAIDRLGNILVSEMVNSRVFLLSSDLEYKREIVSSEYEIGAIKAFLLDEVNGRLFVVDLVFNVQDKHSDNSNWRILMFEIK